MGFVQMDLPPPLVFLDACEEPFLLNFRQTKAPRNVWILKMDFENCPKQRRNNSLKMFGVWPPTPLSLENRKTQTVKLL